MNQPSPLRIDPDGLITAVYTDGLAPLTAEGESVTVRASHVEPMGKAWQADLTPVGGPILTGFALRAEALAAEIAWIEAHILLHPCESCKTASAQKGP